MKNGRTTTTKDNHNTNNDKSNHHNNNRKHTTHTMYCYKRQPPGRFTVNVIVAKIVDTNHICMNSIINTITITINTTIVIIIISSSRSSSSSSSSRSSSSSSSSSSSNKALLRKFKEALSRGTHAQAKV